MTVINTNTSSMIAGTRFCATIVLWLLRWSGFQQARELTPPKTTRLGLPLQKE